MLPKGGNAAFFFAPAKTLCKPSDQVFFHNKTVFAQKAWLIRLLLTTLNTLSEQGFFTPCILLFDKPYFLSKRHFSLSNSFGGLSVLT